jgi:hypothetical protein
MHPRTRRLEHTDRPAPPVGRLHDHLGVRAGLLDRTAQPHRIVVDAHRTSASPSPSWRTMSDRRRCKSIPTYCDAIGIFFLTVLGSADHSECSPVGPLGGAEVPFLHGIKGDPRDLRRFAYAVGSSVSEIKIFLPLGLCIAWIVTAADATARWGCGIPTW